MLYDYNEERKRKYVRKIVLTAEDGTEYKGEFIDLRIDPATIPKDKYVYHCRHDDDGDWCTPVTIEKRVIVNFCGTLITETEINFNEETYIPIEDYYYEEEL